MESIRSPEEVRARLTEDVANGKTVVLSTRELDDPSLREQLPQMLEDLSRASRTQRLGPHLPGYTMLGEIGQGGMSTVYLARQDALNRHVAVKVSPKWLGGGERARERLVQEARAMARVTHNNIVVIHDIIDVDDTFAIAMEWVDGRTLASLLRALPPDPGEHDMAILRAALGTAPEKADDFETSSIRHFVRLIHDIALATQAVHDAGLLHLDIKPSNVLVRRDGTPLLADFGVVREISSELTQTRTFAGTPVYAAPEQLRRDDAKIGPQSDIYSLGVTLYEALARSQPLRALDLPGIVQCVESGRMPRLSEKAAVTPDLENIVHKAIAPEPEHRYATAAEFADDLLAFLEHRPVKARPLTRTQRLRRWARNEPWQAALAITLAVMLPLLGGLGTYLALQLPALHEIELAQRVERANALKQEAFQDWLTRQVSPSQAILQLGRAMELDADDTSLACLLAIANERGWQTMGPLLDTHRAALDDHLGLQLFATKIAERRTYFDAEEVLQLRGSDDPTDQYVLALDRVLHANDASNTAAYVESQRSLESTLLQYPSDPLLLGLLVWVCERTRDEERQAAAISTMWNRWPHNVTMLRWASLTFEPYDVERALTLVDEIIARASDRRSADKLLFETLIRAKMTERLERALEDAAARGMPSDWLETFRFELRLRQGDPVASAAYLADADASRMTTARRLRALNAVDPARAMAFVEEIIASEQPQPYALEACVHHCTDDVDASRALWQRMRELYPDRFTAFARHTWTLYNSGHKREAHEIASLTLPSIFAVDRLSQGAARHHMGERDWDQLQRFADYWIEHGELRAEASYFAAIAALRRGEHLLAAEHIANALSVPGKPSVWYVDALLTDAWLRCSLDAPRNLRNVDLANVRLAEFERRNARLQTPHAGPWTDLVRAENASANGDKQKALELLDRALEPRRPREIHAPRNYREMIEAVRARIRGK